MLRIFIARRRLEQLGRQKDLIPCQAAFAHRCADNILIFIHLRGIEQTIPRFKCVQNAALSRFTAQRPCAETDKRHAHPVIQSKIFHARLLLPFSLIISCFPRVCKVYHLHFHRLCPKAPNFFRALRIFSLQSAVIRRILFIATFFRKDFVS